MTEISTGDGGLNSEASDTEAPIAAPLSDDALTVAPPEPRLTIKAWECLLLAATPVLAGGFPRGPYLTIFSAIALYIIVQLRQRSGRPFDQFERILLSAVGATSVCAAFVSNDLMIALIELVIYGSFFYNLVISVKPLETPLTEVWLFLNTVGACGAAGRHVVTPSVWCHFRPRGIPIPRRSTITSLCILALILIVFHLLLMQVNAEYSDFINDLLINIVHLLQQIISIQFIVEVLCLYLLGAAIFALTNRSAYMDATSPSEELKTLSLDLIIGGVAALLALFSWFQSHAVIQGSLKNNFGEFSRYTQGGFWQLLVVAAVGYILTQLIVRIALSCGGPSPRLRVLTLIFLGELSLLGAFSAHKLGLLQWSFGLKDQRILASLAVCLILLTTVGRFVTFLRKKETPLLRLQIGALVGAVCALSLINIEAISTRLHPMRYFVEDTTYLDYSYLLTNSDDNYSYWPTLIEQATKQGKIPAPHDYYWGQYLPICSGRSYGIDVPFERKLDKLSGHRVDMKRGDYGRWGRRLLNTPINTLLAAQLTGEQSPSFRQFIEYVKATCAG